VVSEAGILRDRRGGRPRGRGDRGGAVFGYHRPV